jgi:hypothetical protein
MFHGRMATLTPSYIVIDEWYFRHPSFTIVCGATFSGKSTWILQLLRERYMLISPSVQRVIFIYSEEQPEYFQQLKLTVPGIEFVKGLEPVEDYLQSLSANVNNLLIFDDLFQEALSSKYFLDLTTKIGHHTSTSIIFTVHNMFQQSKFSKSISNQAKYIVLFKNVRDVNQIKYLGQQVLGHGGGQILEYVINDVTKDDKFGYVILDMHPQSTDQVRIVTKVFLSESPFPIGYEIMDS